MKASLVPAGNSMSFFPVAAAPAVPAPAPAAAPIAAPLPPPASAPIIAPPAAPPPMNPASRLPLPPRVLPAELVAIVYVKGKRDAGFIGGGGKRDAGFIGGGAAGGAINPASRLPLPPRVLPAELVAIVYVLPSSAGRTLGGK